MIEDEVVAKIIQQVSESCAALGIEFFVIGAFAQQPWYSEGNASFRGTNDVDFAVAVPGGAVYEELRQRLTSDGDFRKKKDNHIALVTEERYTVDLIPFENLQNRDKGDWAPHWSGILDRFVGLAEIKEQALTPRKILDSTYAAASIPGIVLLKLISFDDRPEVRLHDVGDIVRILEHFPDLDRELVWDNYINVDTEGLGYDEVAYTVMGLELARIIRGNTDLTDRVASILTHGLEEGSRLLKAMVFADKERNYDLQLLRLKLMHSGFIIYPHHG